MLPSVLGVGVLTGASGADGACTSVRGSGGEGETAGGDELVVGASSMIAPFALQTSNCSLVSPLTPRKLASLRERASSRFAPLRSAPLRLASRSLTLLRLVPRSSASLRLALMRSASLRLAQRSLFHAVVLPVLPFANRICFCRPNERHIGTAFMTSGRSHHPACHHSHAQSSAVGDESARGCLGSAYFINAVPTGAFLPPHPTFVRLCHCSHLWLVLCLRDHD